MTRTTVGFPSPGTVSTSFAMSLLTLKGHPDITRFQSVQCGPGVARARNEMMEVWLGAEDPEDFFLMVDTDMVFDAEHYEQLRDDLIASPMSGAAAALVLTYREGFGLSIAAGPWTTPGRYARYEEVPEGIQYDVCAGAGMVLLRREAVEAIGPALPWDGETAGKPWEYMPPNRSEDVAFVVRLREAGWPLLLDPAVNPGHIKQVTFRL